MEKRLDKCKETENGFRLTEFCKILSISLDLLGYSQEMIHYRRDTNKRLDEIHNSKPFPVNNITTGGKAEGTALYFESDIDRLYAVKRIACSVPGMWCHSPTALALDDQDCSPGYTRLKLERLCKDEHKLDEYLIPEQNGTNVTNICKYFIFHKDANMIDINGVRINKQDKSGPSAPYGNEFINYDFVLGFECNCPDLIEKWISRPRKHAWPDARLIKDISGLEGHVVPVANKGSKFPLTEWRICFTKAELRLMHSLCEFQTKLYIILKLIAKTVLKPLCPEMSSYIMKNIVFWIIETRPKEDFSQPLLIERLVDCLTYLKECIRSNVLKSYMIEERNLFEGRITQVEKELLLSEIDELISEKEAMLQRCDKLRVAMTKLKETPNDFFKEAEKRDRIEKLVYKKNIVFKEIERPDPIKDVLQDRLNSNEVYMQYENELHKLVIPDKIDIIDRGGNADEIYRSRLAFMLS